RDPRLHVAAVLLSVQVLGQVGLGFHVTVFQILAAILTCAVMEVAITYRHSGALVWPASAMLTGNGVALILRAVGQPANDPWGTQFLALFAGVAAFGLATKYLIKVGGTHLFNPSNVALVVAFLLLGAEQVQPLDFWWGPLDGWLILAYAIILVGGILITRRLRLLTMAVAFWVTLAAGLGILAASGHCMTADWAFGPVCGVDFWRVIVTSPEVLIFLFFMITDPKTIPGGHVARILFAVGVGALASLLIAPQTNEWWTKVMLLSSLVLVCVARPLFDRLLPRPGTEEDQPVPFIVGTPAPGRSGPDLRRAGVSLGIAALLVASVGAGIVVAGAPARVEAPATGILLDDAIEIDPDSIPAVTIDPEVTGWNVDRVRADAQGLAGTLARLLRVEDQALLAGDPSLLAAVDHGDRFDELAARLDEARATGRTTVVDYAPDTLFLTQKLLGRQSGMGMAFEATGTQTLSTYDAGGTLLDRQESPYGLTFVMRQVFGDDRWFIVGVLPNE
ncbi:MAG: hypothetical protein ABWZ82_05540, partial [Candidatus Limnocylindrales bacterium]